jgi:hypothetical protein
MAIATVNNLGTMLDIYDENGSRTGIIMIGTDFIDMNYTSSSITVRFGLNHCCVYDEKGLVIQTIS